MTIATGKTYKDDDFLEDEEIIIGISGQEISQICNALGLWKNSCPLGSDERNISGSIENKLFEKWQEIKGETE